MAMLEVDDVLSKEIILHPSDDESDTILNEFDGDVVEIHAEGTVVEKSALVSAIKHLLDDAPQNSTDEAYNLGLASLAHNLGIMVDFEWPEVDWEAK